MKTRSVFFSKNGCVGSSEQQRAMVEEVMKRLVFVFLIGALVWACVDDPSKNWACEHDSECPSGLCNTQSHTCVIPNINKEDLGINGGDFGNGNINCIPAPERCDGIDNNCDGQVDEDCDCIDGQTQLCGSNLGICQNGYQTCYSGFWSECQGDVKPLTEICDGLDNDCDGTIDEGCSCLDRSTKPCGDSTGQCEQGSQYCLNGQWGDCEGDVGPSTEYCDGLDNDCDGITDEACECIAGQIQTCGTNTGECQQGMAFCNNGFWSDCSGEIKPVTEICDGKDNDCDGSVDEGCSCIDGTEKDCGSVVGTCHIGKQSCVNGQWTDCVGSQGPTDEVCDGLDNDCDADIDEDFDLLTDIENCGACGNVCSIPNSDFYCGDGECKIRVCDAGFQNLNEDVSDGCEYSCFPTVLGNEACDYIDNDCDGQVDEAFNLNSDVNNCGECNHACQYMNADAKCSSGNCTLSLCEDGYFDLNDSSADGCEYECLISLPDSGENEACDSLDNDCDGSVDEGCSCQDGKERRCGEYADTGLCHLGSQLCVAGAWQDCLGGYGPQPEVCNGFDDDCDYAVDEDFDLSSDIKNCGGCGVVCNYANAESQCIDGACSIKQCNINYFDFNTDPSDGCETPCVVTNGGVEQCDGIDNDCDGAVDDGFDLNWDYQNCGACGNVCRFDDAVPYCNMGVCELAYCEEGAVDLNQDPSDGCEYRCSLIEEEEVSCDAEDNDCDGSIDEGCECETGATQYCGWDVGDCHFGTQFCINGLWTECQGGVIPQAEVCDGQDNDCDGAIDNGFNFAADVNNCGECNHACSFANAGALCVNSECQIGACDSGYYDLDSNPSTGCEYPCFITKGGVEACDEVDNDCDGQIDETFDLSSDLFNCGSCGNVCDDFYRGIAQCVDSQCALVGCESDFVNLNNESADGCEYHCQNQGDEICDGADNDCDGSVDEGCECDPNTDDPRVCGINVGECRYGRQDCQPDGIWSVCLESVDPMPEVCDYRDNDCDSVVDDGFNLLTDVDNCGECGHVCSAENADSFCMDGSCAYFCRPGFQEMNGNVEDGCEYACFPTNNGVEACDSIDNDCDGSVDEDFDLSSDSGNCGFCNNVCRFVHANAECHSGSCQILSCTDGWVDLNQDSDDGCEFQCSLTANGEELCDGLDNDCNGTVDENCECQFSDDPRVCGVSNTGLCKFGVQTCDSGFWSECLGNADPLSEVCDGQDNDCDNAVDEDFDLTSDPVNCGACGNVCSFNNAGASCVDSVCVMTACDNGYYDFVNGSDDGCETPCFNTNGGVEQCDGIDNDCDGLVDEDFDLSSDLANCGSCGNDCSYIHGQAFCGNGLCGLWYCDQGWVDLNTNPDDGCEYGCNVTGPEACDGLDNDCNGSVDEGCQCQLGTAPLSCGNNVGECRYGQQICLPDNTWSECLGNVDPQPDVCDYRDNDCDGLTDEDFDLNWDVNNCGSCGNVCSFPNGNSVCTWGVCMLSGCDPFYYDYNLDWSDGCETLCAPTNQGVEQCDGIDNDCDGLVDEVFDLQNDASNCGVCGNNCQFSNADAVCSNGQCVQLCLDGWVDLNGNTSDGCEYECLVTNAVELCDGFDNNCNGSLDEGCDCLDGSQIPCGSEEGVCEQGVQSCLNGHWSVCAGEIIPQPETCNYLDDDCDGSVDEDYNLQTDVTNCGICGFVCKLANAVATCSAGTCQISSCNSGYYDLDSDERNGCEYACFVTNNGVEACDGFDNDCDGLVDEDFDLSSDASNCKVCGNVCNFPHAQAECENSACQISGCINGWVDLNADSADGCEYACVFSGLETCDAVDNDCDGSVDEGCSCVNNTTRACGTDEGVCEPGVQNCFNGQWSNCIGEIIPQPEACDSLDNDCDGEVDEVYDLFTDNENCGDCGNVCKFSNATAQCVSGSCILASCNAGFFNYDSDIDNGCEYSCFPTAGGVEACDQIDNDCDGMIDETFNLSSDVNNCGKCNNACVFSHGNAACQSNQCLMTSCQSGWVDLNKDSKDGCEYSCTVTNGGVEACDALDNDCDATVDEGCSCVNGQTRDCGIDTGDCEFGTQTCVNGIWDSCLGGVNSQPELCDLHDNDCDGQVDETFTLQSDVNNCGACGNECKFVFAQASCFNGSCLMGQCEVGHYDLNKSSVDGCEYACFTTNSGTEACDKIDNDCDGTVDEGFNLLTDSSNCGVCGHSCSFSHASSVCSSGLCELSACAAGWVDLNGSVLDGCEYSCTVSKGGVEACDALDNDCDGSTDEGCSCLDGDVLDCGSNFGLCHFGQQTCINGQWSDCIGGTDPQAEICDYADNDCDQQVDEDFSLLTDVDNCGACGHVCRFDNADAFCSAGNCQMGACNSGFQDINGNANDGCEYACFPTNGGAEACDNIDNDCDSFVDEVFNLETDVNNCGSCNNQCSFAHANASCQTGQCVQQACLANYWDLNSVDTDGCEYFCVLSNGGAEACDGLDNNCNGSIDEGCSCQNGQTQNCGIDVGDCHYGTQTCASGVWGTCIGAVNPAPETCDTHDNDCDGSVDEDYSFQTDINNCGSCGNVCSFAHAQDLCVSGACTLGACDSGFQDINGVASDGCEYGCFVTNAGIEQCDGIDNDCDGVIDENLVCSAPQQVRITWTLPQPAQWIYFCSDFGGAYTCETTAETGSQIVRDFIVPEELYKININFSDSPYWGVYNDGSGGLNLAGVVEVLLNGIPQTYLYEPNQFGGGDLLISVY